MAESELSPRHTTVEDDEHDSGEHEADAPDEFA